MRSRQHTGSGTVAPALGKATTQVLQEADLRVSRPCTLSCHHASPSLQHPPWDEIPVAKTLRLPRHHGALEIGNTPGVRFSHADSRCRATRSHRAGSNERALGTGSGPLPSVSPEAFPVPVPPLHRSLPEGSPPNLLGSHPKASESDIKTAAKQFPFNKVNI